MVDLHTNDTLIRTRMAEDVERAAHHRRRREHAVGGRRLLMRIVADATHREATPSRPGDAAFELDRAA